MVNRESESGPRGRAWSAIATSDVDEFVRRLFANNGLSGRMNVGLLRDGTIRSQTMHDMRSGAAFLVEPVYNNTVRTAILIGATNQLEVFNVLGGTDDRYVYDSTGWTPLNGPGEAAAFRGAELVDGKYWYSALIDGNEVRGLALASSKDFEATFKVARVLEDKREMTLGTGSPLLTAALYEGNPTLSFPAGVRLIVTAPDGDTFPSDTASSNLVVVRRGHSLRALTVGSPAAGKWTGRVVAVDGAYFQLKFQTSPSTDAKDTVMEAVKRIYSLAAEGDATGPIECNVCYYSTCALVAAAGLAIAVISFAAAPLAAIVAAIAAAVGIELSVGFFKHLYSLFLPDVLVTLLCKIAGFCEMTTDDQKLIETVTNGAYRYDQYCHLTTHNAFAYRNRLQIGYFQQSTSIREQLEAGVDALMLDIWPYKPGNSPKGIHLCHGECDTYSKWFALPYKQPESLANALTVVVDALKDDPNRILTLIFESRVNDLSDAASLIQEAFQTSGAAEYALDPRKETPWNVRKKGWPTFQWMRDNNKRLVVLSDQRAEIRRYDDGLPFVWEFTAETAYGDSGMSGPVDKRQGSMALDKRMTLGDGSTRWPPLIMNWFPTWSAGSVVPPLYEGTNDANKIMARVNALQEKAGRPPTFLAVDHFQYGAHGGPTAARAAINHLWRNRWGGTE